jgi:hypothetical protein
MLGQRDECVLQVRSGHLQLRDLDAALEERAQHCLGLVREQLHEAILDRHRAHGKALENLFVNGRRDEADALARDF